MTEPSDRLWPVIALLAAYHLALGLFELFAPGAFFDQIGNYGAENQHYVGDAGSFTAAYGIALAVAVRRPGWRAPILWLGAIWYAIHGLNHAADTAEAVSAARGWADTALILVGAALLALVARAAGRAEAQQTAAADR